MGGGSKCQSEDQSGLKKYRRLEDMVPGPVMASKRLCARPRFIYRITRTLARTVLYGTSRLGGGVTSVRPAPLIQAMCGRPEVLTMRMMQQKGKFDARTVINIIRKSAEPNPGTTSIES